MTRTIFIALPLFLLAACNSEPAGKSTAKLDAVDKLFLSYAHNVHAHGAGDHFYACLHCFLN